MEKKSPHKAGFFIFVFNELDLAAATRCTASVTLETRSVANHGKVLAFGAAVAGIALHHRLDAAVSFQLLGGIRTFRAGGSSVCCSLIREKFGCRC